MFVPLAPSNVAVMRRDRRLVAAKRGDNHEAYATIGLGGVDSRWLLYRARAGDAGHRAMGSAPRFSILCSRNGLRKSGAWSEVQILHHASRHGRSSTAACARHDAAPTPARGEP